MRRWPLSRCMLLVFVAALILSRTHVIYWRLDAQCVDVDFWAGMVTFSHNTISDGWQVFNCNVVCWGW